jgi:hypothetical protein
MFYAELFLLQVGVPMYVLWQQNQEQRLSALIPNPNEVSRA